MPNLRRLKFLEDSDFFDACSIVAFENKMCGSSCGRDLFFHCTTTQWVLVSFSTCLNTRFVSHHTLVFLFFLSSFSLLSSLNGLDTFFFGHCLNSLWVVSGWNHNLFKIDYFVIIGLICFYINCEFLSEKHSNIIT